MMGPSGQKVHCATACGGKVVPLGTKGGRVVVAAFAAAFEKGARLTAQVGAARGGGLCRRVVFADAQGKEAAYGHACGVRVQRVLRVLRFDSPSG